MSRKQKAAQAQKDAAEAAKRAREAKAKKKKKPISFFDEKPAEPTGSAFAAQLLRQRHAAAFKEQLTEALPRPDPTTSRLPLPESLDRGTMWPRPADAFDEMLLCDPLSVTIEVLHAVWALNFITIFSFTSERLSMFKVIK
jgi:hypothetical protein